MSELDTEALPEDRRRGAVAPEIWTLVFERVSPTMNVQLTSISFREIWEHYAQCKIRQFMTWVGDNKGIAPKHIQLDHHMLSIVLNGPENYWTATSISPPAFTIKELCSFNDAFTDPLKLMAIHRSGKIAINVLVIDAFKHIAPKWCANGNTPTCRNVEGIVYLMHTIENSEQLFIHVALKLFKECCFEAPFYVLESFCDLIKAIINNVEFPTYYAVERILNGMLEFKLNEIWLHYEPGENVVLEHAWKKIVKTLIKQHSSGLNFTIFDGRWAAVGWFGEWLDVTFPDAAYNMETDLALNSGWLYANHSYSHLWGNTDVDDIVNNSGGDYSGDEDY
jgi:hypothetical protein